ncbi:MAG: metallophosphoesterase [Lentisphaeria bacterium]|nr:metallophosphoesterase [Lentisphaeria bacterium]
MSEPLRVAIIGDSQAYPRETDWGTRNLIKAFELLAPKKPQVLLMAGDLADGTNFATFDTYRKLLDRYFDKDMVHVGCAGNHDYWVPRGQERDPEGIYREFCTRLHQKHANPLHEVVNGMSFIALSEDFKEVHSEEMLGLLENEIKTAIARDPEKPVFVITHFPPANTMSGSLLSSGRAELRNLFNRYKQVVSISGHTHYPLEDERCIWQGEFTAFTVDTLAYSCMDDGFYNTCGKVIVPFAREGIQALYMEIFDDRFEIHRYNVEDQREIKPDAVWSVAIPYDPAKAVYTADRKLQRKAPQFPAGATASFRYDFGYLYLLIDPAEHDDFVHWYKIRVIECGEEEKLISEEKYCAGFYRLERYQGGMEVFRLPGDLIKPKSHCRFEIIPVESFGHEGEALVIEADIPGALSFRSGVPECPQE